MRKLGSFIGSVLFYGSGLLMFIFWVGSMSDWLGVLGTIISIVIAPGLVIFPLVYWIVEGVFPIMYFVIWGIGIAGMYIRAYSSED